MSGDLDATWGAIGVTLVVLATLAISTWGFRLSRTTSDFFVASRMVRPGMNASAIGGEYVSAASFLGVAGLVMAFGAEMLWYPVGWTAGYLVLLALVAAPLRRSGAYTLPDFAEARLASTTVRSACALLVVAIGWLYLLPQFQGAGLTMTAVTGAPRWVGGLVVTLVVLVGVASGGMRSITLVQAFQYWLKLTALLVPLAVLVVVWAGDGRPIPATLADGVAGGGSPAGAGDDGWSTPFGGGLSDISADGVGLYLTYSVMVATFFGAMGLPHVVVRFYTNPDGRAARRTTLSVLALLGVFYLLPPVYGALGRIYDPDPGTDGADTLVLRLPGLMIDGTLADVLTAVLTAGAFAAFLSTSSGLTIAVAGVLSQAATRRQNGVVRRGAARLDPVTAFRVGAVLAASVPCLAALAAPDLPVARSVGLAFAVAASTFCPLLVLGIWWRGLTDRGALIGLLVGGTGSFTGVVASVMIGDDPADDWLLALLTQPAAWSVPLAFVTMVVASRLTRSRVPAGVDRFMVRLHTPEALQLDRGEGRG